METMKMAEQHFESIQAEKQILQDQINAFQELFNTLQQQQSYLLKKFDNSEECTQKLKDANISIKRIVNVLNTLHERFDRLCLCVDCFDEYIN